MDYDFTIKIIIIGNTNVGKSCILTKFIDNEFISHNTTTIGVDYKTYYTTYLDKDIKLLIWDTAGQERFKSITKTFYKGVQVVIICFDLTNYDSFEDIDIWMEEIKKEKLNSPIIILVGTKSDLTSSRVITKEEALKKITQLKLDAYFETSAKTNQGIEDIFNSIVKLYCLLNDIDKIKKSKPQTLKNNSSNIKLKNQTNKKSNCFGCY